MASSIKTGATLLAGAGAALAGVALIAAAQNPSQFSEITVERINLVEPDGTMRMIISNSAQAPGLYSRNAEHPHPSGRNAAGIIFLNDEGTELGGLIYTGGEVNGLDSMTGQLSFDRHNQDQVLALQQFQQGDRIAAGLSVTDRPGVPLDFERLGAVGAMTPEEQQEAISELVEAGMLDAQQRLFVGRSLDGASVLMLNDGTGRPRLLFSVGEDGAVSANILAEDGSIVRDLLSD